MVATPIINYRCESREEAKELESKIEKLLEHVSICCDGETQFTITKELMKETYFSTVMNVSSRDSGFKTKTIIYPTENHRFSISAMDKIADSAEEHANLKLLLANTDSIALLIDEDAYQILYFPDKK